MKNLNMKQKKTVLTVMMAISFALLLLANFLHGLGRTVAWILLIVSLGMFVLVWAKIWRCPYCGKHLGRMADGATHCPSCGMPIEKKPKE